MQGRILLIDESSALWEDVLAMLNIEITNSYNDHEDNIRHLRSMMAELLELQSAPGLTTNEVKRVKLSIRAMKSAIDALEVQVLA